MLGAMRRVARAVTCATFAVFVSASSDASAEDPVVAKPVVKPVVATQLASDPLADGKLGLSLGVTSAVGASSSDFGFGLVVAAEAAYQPIDVDSVWGWGLHWSTAYCWCSASAAASVTGNLRSLSMSLGARVRRAMSELRPRFAFVGAGVELLRTNVPVPPDDQRDYLGPYVSAGVEQYQGSGSYLVGFEVRYGMIATGPSNLSILLSFGFGN